MNNQLLIASWRRVQWSLLPGHCLLCHSDSGIAQDLCVPCAGDLPRNRICCPRCALPLSTPAPLCGECLQQPPPFAAASAAFVYAAPLDQLMTRFKFGASLAAGRVLAEAWIGAICDAPPLRPDALVPVPLHAARLRERGYNQALELARPLARAASIALRPDLLLRQRATVAQSDLDAVARRRNLHGAFVVPASMPLPAHVAVVDDVMTTGTTLRECARTLRRAGVARVDVWVLARAPKPRERG